MLNKSDYRIVHLSKYYPPDRGGIETHVQTLAQAQSALGAKVEVLCVNSFNKQGQLSKRTETVQEMDGDVKVTRIGRLFTLARFDICPELSHTISETLKKPNTLLHLHTPNPTMMMGLISVYKNQPLVVSHHSDIVKQKFLKYGLRPFEDYLYNRSSKVLTSSLEYIEGSKFLKLYQNKLNYLHLGLDTSEHSEPNEKAKAFAKSLTEKYPGPIWLAVGRLVYYKAYHIAIEALTMVKGTLVIVGVGPLEEELKTLAKKLGVYNRIVWLGNLSHDELIGAYHAATGLWFASNVRSEAFGLVQVEAMASGCPVINASIPGSGVPFVSRHNQEGLTVPVNNPAALAQAAQKLLDEPELHSHLAKQSQKRAKYFNEQRMAKESLRLYDEALVGNCGYNGGTHRANDL